MARLDDFIFGYYRGKVGEKDSPKLLNTFLKLGICSSVTPSGEFSLGRKDNERFRKYAGGRLHFEIGEPRGIYGFFRRIRYRYGLIAALAILIVTWVVLSGLVWDVRVSGNEKLPDYVISSSLDELGFGVGTRWRSVDKNEIETELLSKMPDIAWISVNRRGTVAYVEVIESENVLTDKETGPIYSNIVAETDGVVEDISVQSGTAVVKIGDVVKKGDILISGVMENENGVSFCRAKGEVRARSVCDVSAETETQAVDKQVKRRKLTYARVVLFKFSINIFKNYGNCENSCDIIEEIREFALFDKYKLPIRFERAYAYEYEEYTRTRSREEMISVTKQRLDAKIYTLFKDADVIKLRTVGEFGEFGYRLTSRVVYSVEIGKESAIEIN